MKKAKNIIEKRILDIVSEFINEYCPNVYASMISGSVAEGKNHCYSDIDVLIFDKDRENFYMETLEFKGEKIQAIVLPVHKIDEILLSDYNSFRGAFVDMLPKGVILYDTSNFLKNLIEHTQELQEIGRPCLNEMELKSLKVELTSMLCVLKGSEKITSLLFLVGKLAEAIADFKLKTSGNWVGAPKHKLERLKRIDINFANKLTRGVEEFYKNSSKDLLIDLAESTLNEYGGGVVNYSNSAFQSHVSSDYLVIELYCPYLSDNDLTKEKIKSIGKYLNGVDDVKGFYFMMHKTVKDIVQNVYVVVEANKEFINNSLIIDLDKYLKSVNGGQGVLFPFDFNPIHQFSSEEIYKRVSPAFYTTSRMLLDKSELMFDEKFQKEFVLGLFKTIKSIWFRNDSKKFVSFLAYLLECWLILSYDNGTLFNTRRIVERKKKTLEAYQKRFLEESKSMKLISDSIGFNYPDIIKVLDNISISKQIEEIPMYKAYLLNESVTSVEASKWTFYKEFIKRQLSGILIDNTELAYFVFALQKIEN